MAAATALPLSPSSSPVHNLTTQFSTTNIGWPMDITTTTVTSNPIRTSGPHILVKLLAFDPKQPKRWFQQTEAIFRRSHVVSSQDKWDYVLPKLPTDVLNDISDVVDSLLEDTPNPYELVKNRLLETYTPTRWQLARQLLNFPQVSGVRPTMLMNQLLSLLPPGDHPETMFLMLFLDRLPPNISARLTARTFRHPRDMATYADQIWDSTPPPVQPVAALPFQSRSSSPASTVSMRSVSRSGRRRSRSPAPTADLTTATTIGGLAWRLIIARPPVPGSALWRETAPPPVDHKHRFHRRPSASSHGRAHWPHLSG